MIRFRLEVGMETRVGADEGYGAVVGQERVSLGTSELRFVAFSVGVFIIISDDDWTPVQLFPDVAKN